MALSPTIEYKLRIFCTTYNHVNYVTDTMNGFCMQKTDFPFVAIIIDDASTDGEQEVICKYLDEHFDMDHALHYEDEDAIKMVAVHKTNSNCHFLVILLKYNFYSLKKAKNPLYKGWYENVPYVAFCEGDDYWTDSNKLQIQVDFLDSHPDYSMCFHDVDIRAEKGRDWYDAFGVLENRDYTGLENMLKWSVPTCSMVYRKEIGGMVPKNAKFRMGDNVLVLTCSKYGKIRCISKKMGVYRLTPTSWIGGQSDKVQRYKYISHYLGVIEEFEECRCPEVYNQLEGQYFQLLAILKREGNKEEFEKIKKEYLNYPGVTHWSEFHSYYRKSQFRYYVKKLLGDGFVSLYRKVRYGG